MAEKVAAASGVWSAAATWNSVTNTPTIHATSNATVGTSAIFSATFTAPNTTNAATGVMIYITQQSTAATTLTATLQESGVDTAAAVTITLSNVSVIGASGLGNNEGTYVYLRLPTPYVFTTTGAGAYRWKLVVNTGSILVANNSGATNFFYRSTDDRTGAPASTDEAFIVGQNATTDITVTVDSSQTIGNGTYTGLTNNVGTDRQIGYAVVISENGILAWDTTADATLTHKGSIDIGSGGEWRMGTVASPTPAARIAKSRFDWGAATNGQFGFNIGRFGKFICQGVAKSSTSLWKTKYASGSGTTASPLVTADAVDWSVGDEIIVGATSNNATNYNESERKFIRTKNSATSYTLADTSGGAESGLSHTHTTDAWILNLQRNVILDSTDTAKGYSLSNRCTVAGNVDCDWVRFETLAGVVLLAFDVDTAADNNSNPTALPAFDYCVIYRVVGTRPGWQASRSGLLSFTGLIFTQSNTTIGGALSLSGSNKTYTDCFAIDNNGVGVQFVNAFNTTFNRVYVISNCKTTTTVGGICFQGGGGSFNNCEIHANRARGIYCHNPSIDSRLGALGAIFTNLLCGTKGTNAIDFDFSAAGNISDATFINSTFGSVTFVANYLSATSGSIAKFQTLNLTANNHIWYTNTGIARSSGAGLVDTTTKTAGNFAARIAPENAGVGFVWEFLVGIKANSAASVFGFAQKNAAFGSSVCTIELFLPGSTAADATATLDNTTGSWQVFNLAANYTGSVAAFATVRITAKTTTAAAYVYFTDFYNGTNVLTGLQAWYQGRPTPVMTDLLGDPASVWAILENTQTTPGTMGYEISTDLATLRADVDDLQARIPTTLTPGGNIKADTLMIEGVDATNQIRDAILTDATRFAGADIALIKGFVDTEITTLLTNVAAILTEVDTEIGDIRSRLPAALVGGRMDSDIGNIQAAILLVIADAILKRGVSNTQDTADLTSLTELILAAFESSVSGTNWSIRKTGGTTFNTRTLTLDAAALPIAGVT